MGIYYNKSYVLKLYKIQGMKVGTLGVSLYVYIL